MESLHFLNGQKGDGVVSRGFTLVEMVVVLTIITILAAIILSNQNAFNRTLLLTDTAYTVALSVREAESLGLSSQKFVTPQNQTILNAGYGLHFESDSMTSYIQFADVTNSPLPIPAWCPTGTPGMPDAKPGNCLYDGANELSQKYNFTQGFKMGDFCGYYNGNLVGCASASNGLASLDIVFVRPNTSAIMTGVLTNGTEEQLDTACIEMLAPDGVTKNYVKVTTLGEILVTDTCP